VLSWVAELGNEQLTLVFVEPELAPDVNALEGWPIERQVVIQP